MDARVTEFHCIMPMANVPSVLERGILSYERAAKIQHHSVALQPVQDKRDQKQVPGGLKLHQYAKFYSTHAIRCCSSNSRRRQIFAYCAFREMCCNSKAQSFSDQNAASDYVRFLHPKQWQLLDFDAIYAMDWRHPGNPAAYYRHRAQKCAEVLIPNRLEERFLIGAYVRRASKNRLEGFGRSLQVTPDPVLFFR